MQYFTVFIKPKVGDAFESLLREGRGGDVLAVWKDAPPYLVPDTGMAVFVAATACAMAFRFVPGFGPRSSRVIGPYHMAAVALFAVVLPWVGLAWLLLG